jgi:hypothetical protein
METAMSALKDNIDRLWPGHGLPERPASVEGLGAAPGFRPRSTPAEMKAEETTRVAREATEADAQARLTKTERLRRMRLEKEEAARAEAALATPKKKRK